MTAGAAATVLHPVELDQASFGHRDHLVSCDEEVVEKSYVNELEHGFETLRDEFIRFRRFAYSAWMAVQCNHRGGVVFEDGSSHLPGMHARSVNGSGKKLLMP